MITATTTQTNAGWDKKLLKLLPQLAKKQVAVGFPKGAGGLSQSHYAGGESILDVAAANEYGTETQPRRPFMHHSRPELAKMFKQAQAALAKKAKEAIEGGQTVNIEPALK